MSRVWASAALALVLSGCGKESAPAVERDPNVHVLVLPGDDFALPDAPGKREYTAVCTACHSARYVANQPPLGREGWAKVVDKMKKSYGVTVPEDLAPALLGYLVAVHGPA